MSSCNIVNMMLKKLKKRMDGKKEIDNAIFRKNKGWKKLRTAEIHNILDQYKCFTENDKDTLIDTLFKTDLASTSLSYIREKIVEFAKNKETKI